MKKMRTFVIIFFVTCVFFTDLAYAQTDKNAIPSWGLGPFERDEAAYKIGPNPESEFKCPIKGTEVNWEEKSILCASANVKEEKVFLLYRAEDNSRKPSWGTSRIGLAVSDDGVNFDRHLMPVLYPDNDFMLKYEWPGGCQDPRIVKTEDGRYIITYTAWDGKVARLCIAESKDMYKWEKKGLAFNAFKNGKYNDMWTKAGAIICRQENDEFVATKINGRYWMYFGEFGLMLANSDDLINWNILENAQGDPLIVLPTRPKKWDNTVTESGALAMIAKDGIHMIYNGGTDQGEKHFGLEGTVWAMGQVLFSKEDPSKVIARTEDNFFRPEREYEINYVGESAGGNTNVTFIEGLIWFNNEWRFYYGCADSYVATAVFKPNKK